MKIASIALAFLIALPPYLAFAGTGVNFMGKEPTADELVDALAMPEEMPTIKFRGIQMSTQSPSLQAMEAAVPKNDPRAILDIKFEYDSDKLTAKAMRTLNELGKALNSDELKNNTFIIEGHTDAHGADIYNMQLSMRRAQAASDYLQMACGVSKERLVVKGYGESQPLDKNAPEAGTNRRVEVVNFMK